MSELFLNPPREFSLLPFWFWNDDLREAELLRQMDDFRAHGVYGFVIHPRVGLPREISFMSERMLHFVRFAVEAAAERNMLVVLYDEGMYPSGSASGLVVKENASHQCRCFSRRELIGRSEPSFRPGEQRVAVVARRNGERIAVMDRPLASTMRGLHYIGDGPEEERPPAADILNPDAVRSFIRIVYDGYFAAVGDHFGKTVMGIFTDEPNPLGKHFDEKDVIPGTTGFLDRVSSLLGYDFTPHLPALWYDDEPEAGHFRREYARAVKLHLAESYYRPLRQWCEAHGISLMGHPSRASDIGMERFFHIPGQDLVWRAVIPWEASGLEGEESTQAKCSSSAMIHGGARRNSNECFGAYGHGLTWEEMKALANWCFVRGVNMLIPHAFYYSIRGPRRDERPPDVGPHSPWWDRYRDFAGHCMRLSWLNTDCRHICHVAILAEADSLPWRAARACFQRQRDFNYLELQDLSGRAVVTPEGVRLAGMEYRAIILEEPAGARRMPAEALDLLDRAGRLIRYSPEDDPESLIARMDRLIPPDVVVAPPQPSLRCRHVWKCGAHYYLFVNESAEAVEFVPSLSERGPASVVDPLAGRTSPYEPERALRLERSDVRVLVIRPE